MKEGAMIVVVILSVIIKKRGLANLTQVITYVTSWSERTASGTGPEADNQYLTITGLPIQSFPSVRKRQTKVSTISTFHPDYARLEKYEQLEEE